MIMDFQWINQQESKKMNSCDHKNAGNKIDLTLKLGLPNCDENYQPPHIGQHLDFDQIMTPHHPNLEGINHYKMLNEGMNMSNNIGQSFNGNEISWPPPPKFGNQYIHPQYLHSNINNSYGFGPFSSSSDPYYYHHCNSNINPNNNNLLSAAAMPAAATMNDYTLLDIPSRRVEREFIAGSSSRRKVGMRRQRGGGFTDPYKRCTNYNCNTNDTPMWRRGPLGPKTLCNACGIKYRKEEEKRMAKEGDKSKSQDSNAQTA